MTFWFAKAQHQFTCHNKWIGLVESLILTGIIVLTGAVPGWSATYQCIQDTYLDALYPDDNFGGSDRLLVANNTLPARALLRFYIPDSVEEANISAARLVIHSAPWTSGGGGEIDFEIYALTRTWVEGSCRRSDDYIPPDGATWSQYLYNSDSSKNQWTTPGGDYDTSSHMSGTFPVGNAWEEFAVDVTPLAKDKLIDVKNNGFLIKHPSEDGSGGWQNFASRNSTGYDPPFYPTLEIDYVEPLPNQPPYAASNPQPEDGAVDVPPSPVLSWSGGDPDSDNIVTHDIYLSSGRKRHMDLVSANQTATTYTPDTLDINTSYTWQVITRDNYGAETAGPLWKFTTVEYGITSVFPTSGSARYNKDGEYVAVPMLLYIKGEGTHFKHRESIVSLGDTGITVTFSIPRSRTELLAGIIIGESAKAGPHTITVTTGDEVAVGSGLFEVKKFWRGDEEVTVTLGSASVVAPLKGLPVYLYKGKEAVLLSDIIEKAVVTDHPEDYYYNFIASDGYSLERGIILGGWGTGLPPWSDMEKGYFYETTCCGLSVGWDPDTIGGEIGQYSDSCYNVKYMDGGTIEIREEDIIPH